jgi:phosphopantothenoylcysteine synthetase/decarboxylase
MSKNIVLGVTASIAAHKAADLASRPSEMQCARGDDRRRQRSHALPFKTLSRNPVVTVCTTKKKAGTDPHPARG